MLKTGGRGSRERGRKLRGREEERTEREGGAPSRWENLLACGRREEGGEVGHTTTRGGGECERECAEKVKASWAEMTGVSLTLR